MRRGRTTWLGKRERGTMLAMRVAFGLAQLVGRAPMRPLVLLIALWYRLFDRAAVRASREWFDRLQGHPPDHMQVYRHMRTFAQVTLDRVFLLQGRTRGLSFTHTGRELLARQQATGRGAVLLGAHLGSFEAMRVSGADQDLRVNLLGYFDNARMINALLERLNPGLAAQVIPLGRDPVEAMLGARACIERGEFVALLGDRVGLNDRVVRARFMGADAPFAAGPFLLASLLHCPVYLVFGLYSEPNRYDLHCETFAERIHLAREDRRRALQRWVELYAERLEFYAHKAPDNWFNWFDFWERP